MEAAWKYLIINSIGLLLGFFRHIAFLHGPDARRGEHIQLGFFDGQR